MSNCKISVIMPVYNGAKFLRDAVDSILSQSFRDFEFIIINDGSRDESVDIIKSYNDTRIRFINNSKNMGLVYSLNRGLSDASGRYIARMDCDDVSLPGRLQLQYDFMEANPGIGLCGGAVEHFNEKGVFKIQRYPVYNYEIKAALLFGCTFCHPAVMIRKVVIDQNNLNYDDKYKHAEDYKLWVDLSDKTDFHNLKDIILRYRIHDASVCSLNVKEQSDSDFRVKKLLFQRLCIPGDKEFKLFRKIYFNDFTDDERGIETLDLIYNLFNLILEQNKKMKIFPKSGLSEIVCEKFIIMMKKHLGIGKDLCRFYISSRYRGITYTSFLHKYRLFRKYIWN